MRVVVSLLAGAALALVIVPSGALAQSVRDHTRLKRDGATPVTEAQASELTLTLTEAAVRPIQVRLRTAGGIDPSRRLVLASLPAQHAEYVKVGQLVWAFPPESRSSMYQARVSKVETAADRVLVSVTLSAPGLPGSSRYVLEIITERGDLLSVPNEAIIETAGTQRVYVQEEAGRYAPRQIEPGIQGELYTEVRSGLKAGEEVVTFGSFFIDAEHKLKGF